MSKPLPTMRRLPAALSIIALALPAGPAEASRPPGTTFEVTVRPDGQPAGGAPESCQSNLACSASVDMSSDGRYVAFATPFTDILPGDNNGAIDVFVRDTLTGTTELISVSKDGGFANDTSADPSISDDGRYVAFMSLATDLTEEPGSEGIDVYVRDRVLGVTTLESFGPEGQLAGFQGIDDAVLSGNGRYLVFQSGGFNDDTTNDPVLPFGGINFLNVYRRDLVERRTELVSLTHEGKRSLSVDITLDENAISADGSVIAFASQRHDLVPNDTNGMSDIFVADLDASTIERVSVASDGRQANWINYRPALSGDGRFVSFSSAANNLVPVDTTSSRVPVVAAMGGSQAPDVFVHDRETGVTERVSITSTGLEPGDAYFNDISDDGRFVAFSAPNGDYDEEGLDYYDKLWIHDRLTGQTDLMSMFSDGEPFPSAFASTMSLSGDGGRVAFAGPSPSSPFANAVYVHSRPNQVAVVGGQVSQEGDTASVSGLLRLPGEVLLDAPLSADVPLGPAATAVTVIQRPELDDVLVKVGIDGLPSYAPPTPGGSYTAPSRRPMAPAGFLVRLAGDGLSVTVTPTITSTGDGGFEAVVCTDVCGATLPVEGSIGVAGDEARLSIPAYLLGGAQLGVSVLSNVSQESEAVAPGAFQVFEVEASLRAGDGTAVPVGLASSDRTAFTGSVSAGPSDPLTLIVCTSSCRNLPLR